MKFLKKLWPHIFVISLILFLMLGAPVIYKNYFVRQGKPKAEKNVLPTEINASHFILDGMKEFNSQGIFQLSGWAFLTVNKNIPGEGYERQLILQSAANNYVFPVDSTERVDIQSAFKYLNMDVTMSGFSALVFKDSIDTNIYSLGLLFNYLEAQSTYYVNFNQCIIRTPNRFLLVGVENRDCRSVTHNVGNPIHLNISLPIQIAEVKYNLENLKALDDRGFYQLSGWAFPQLDKNIPSSEYLREAVLSNNNSNLVYKANTLTRVDVQNHFSDLGMDLAKSGLSAIISQEGLIEGTYHLGFIFKDISNGTMYYFDTEKCISKNGDVLILVNPGSPGCTTSSP